MLANATRKPKTRENVTKICHVDLKVKISQEFISLKTRKYRKSIRKKIEQDFGFQFACQSDIYNN